MKPFITIFTLFSLLISISLITPATIYAVSPATYDDEGFDETSTSCITFKSPSFKIGQRDTNTQGDVTLLQNYLISKGYLTGTAVGAYGTRTATAVRKFQKDKGISQTGNVGPRTKIAIQEDSCSSSHEDDEELSVTPTAPTAASTAPTCSNPKEYYYYHNVDVKNAGVDAITHWNEFGMKEGRRSCWTGAQSTATQSTGTAGGSNAVSGAVPQVTIKAKPYYGVMPNAAYLYLVTWTATNNPTYCTATGGENTNWSKGLYESNAGAISGGVKNIPSTAASYNQLLRSESETPSATTFSISCTNAYGTSAVVTATAPAVSIASVTTLRGKGQDQACTWSNGVSSAGACDMQDHLFNFSPSLSSSEYAKVYDAKICTTEMIDGVFTSPNVTGPCSTSAEFTLIRNTSGVRYNAADRKNYMGSIPHYLSRSYKGGAMAGITDGTPRERTYNVIKGSDGKEGLITWMNGNPGWVDNASSRVSMVEPVTSLSITSQAPKTVRLTWSATNNPIWCVAKGGTPGWAGFKTAPINSGSVSQTLYLTTPGTYTYDLYCVNFASAKKASITSVSKTITVSGN